MSTHPGWWLRSSKTLGFLAAFLLVLAGTSQNPRPVSAAERYPADFDPLQDLPLPPAWRDTEAFATTLEALRDQVASAGKARVRVDLRLPAVEPDRLDEAQSVQWEQDQAAVRADLLDALPDGSYRRLDEGPEVKSLIRAGAGAGVVDDAPDAVDDPTAFDWPADANAVKPPASAVAAPSLTLEVGEAALEGLMASALMAKVQASAGNARIAAGRLHSLYLGSNGSLWAWGSNGFGQLGDGTTTGRTTPKQILTGVAAVAAGDNHTLALKTDGSLWAWGSNGSGQLGDGTTTNRSTPTQVLTGVAAVAAGNFHTLAIKTDGSLWTWGSNVYEQVTSPPRTYRATPILSQWINGVVAVACGTDYNLALKTDGSLWAWGRNDTGQLGGGTNTTDIDYVQVVLDKGIDGIAAGGGHSLALLNSFALAAWGNNNSGQLGDGTTTTANTPKYVFSSAHIRAVDAGSFHTLALNTDGSLRAWGYNGFGQLGDGTTTSRYTPTPIITGVASVAAGDNHTLALKTDGSLWTWGYNGSGQLGDGTTTTGVSPVQVTGVAADPPVTPTNLGAQAVSPTSINLAWTDASANELGFEVERRTGEGAWAWLATLGANATTYVDTRLTQGITYGYRVRAYNTAGASPYSNEVSATYQLAVTATAGIGGTASCNPATVNYNDSSTCTASPDTGYAFVAWTGACAGQGAACSLTGIQADKVSAASFALKTYDVTATAGANGSISPASQAVAHGATTTFTVTPTTDYTASVSGCGGSLSGSTYTTGAITAACVVSASFTLNSYTVTASADANGTISPASQTVAHGATTTFAVTPETGYSATVSGCGGSLSGTTYTTGPITAACAVSASFTLNSYTVTATAGANGTISPTSRSVAHGATTTFTVTPETGYSASVTGCGGTLTGTTYTTDAITAACAVTASFGLILPSVPTNFTASAVSATRIQLIWEDHSDNESAFQIERKTGADGTWDQIATAPANTILYADNVTVGMSDLIYRVRAANDAGSSGYSNEAVVTAAGQRRLAAGRSHSLYLGSDGSL